ncbi:MAG: ATP-binding cassette domain-containing protein [Actinomycetota bacterium]|jgi:ABC-type sugar transport system ATPase subunit|nr:ATP-binding cassette domain-containing protein [Actinomycetota bacterium]
MMEAHGEPGGGTNATAQQEQAPVFHMEKICKHFGGVQAAIDVSIALRAREVVALVGNNGAGKSTVLRIASGVIEPDSGKLYLDGKQIELHGPREARALGMETVPQELSLAPHLSVAANMFLGREVVRGWGPLRILNKSLMRRRTAELIGGFGIHIPNLDGRVFDLSGGQQQGVAIGRALAWGSRVVILDEPTAALGIEETARVESTLLKMREAGVGVLLVSHNLDQVFRVSDRIYVLRRGRIVGERMTNATTADEIVALITGATTGTVEVGQSGEGVDNGYAQ